MTTAESSTWLLWESRCLKRPDQFVMVFPKTCLSLSSCCYLRRMQHWYYHVLPPLQEGWGKMYCFITSLGRNCQMEPVFFCYRASN